MMICKADFEELFPHLFQPEQARTSRQVTKPPSAECLARWENEGGRARPVPAPNQVRSSVDDSLPTPAGAGEVFSTMPAAAAYAAVWVSLTTYDHMMRWNPAIANIGRH